MRSALVFVHNIFAGTLVEVEFNRAYRFDYAPEYSGDPISLTMPRKILRNLPDLVANPNTISQRRK